MRIDPGLIDHAKWPGMPGKWELSSIQLSHGRSMETCTPTIPYWKPCTIRRYRHSRSGHPLGSAITRPRPNHQPASRITANRIGATEMKSTWQENREESLESKSSALPEVYRLNREVLKMSTCPMTQCEKCVNCLLSNYIMFEIASCTTSTTARSIVPKNWERGDFSML